MNAKKVVGGLFAAFLLLPVPVFAALDFSTSTWKVLTNTNPTDTNDVFSGIGAVGSTFATNTNILTIPVQVTNSNAHTTTVAIQGTGITGFTGGDQLVGSIQGLSNLILNNGNQGSWKVTVDTTNGSPTNMFTYDSSITPTPPAGASLTPSALTANPVITVTFTLTNVKFNNSSSSNIFVSFASTP